MENRRKRQEKESSGDNPLFDDIHAYLGKRALTPFHLETLTQQLPTAPEALVRRFSFRLPPVAADGRPQAGISWLAVEDMPDGLFSRYMRANKMVSGLILLTINPEAKSTLAKDDVLKRFSREHQGLPLADYAKGILLDFDLHDVYVCLEARLLENYAQLIASRKADDQEEPLVIRDKESLWQMVEICDSLLSTVGSLLEES